MSRSLAENFELSSPPPPLFVQGGGLEASGIPNLHKRLPGLLLLPPHLCDVRGDNE